MMRLMYGKPLGTCLMHSDAYLGAINYQLHLPQARHCRHSTEPSPPPGQEAVWLQNSVPSSSLVREVPLSSTCAGRGEETKQSRQS